jgi:hypothetical protein
VNVEKIQSNIQLPPELQDAYERVVAAGMKVLFSKETHPMVLEQLDGPGDMATKIGEGIARVVVFLFNESNGTMPEDVIVPAGILLILKASEFINQSGLGEVSDEEVGRAMEIMISALFDGFGADRSEFDAAMAEDGAAMPEAMV